MLVIPLHLKSVNFHELIEARGVRKRSRLGQLPLNIRTAVSALIGLCDLNHFVRKFGVFECLAKLLIAWVTKLSVQLADDLEFLLSVGLQQSLCSVLCHFF